MATAGRKKKSAEDKAPRGKSRQWYAPDPEVDRKQMAAFEHDKAAMLAEHGATLSWSAWVSKQLLRRADEIAAEGKKKRR